MKQLMQDLRTHEIAVEEVPAPGCAPGGVLVRTVASLISSGTERAAVKLGSMSLVGKALERPDLVKSLVRASEPRRAGKRRCDRARQARQDYLFGLQCCWRSSGGGPGGAGVPSRPARGMRRRGLRQPRRTHLGSHQLVRADSAEC